MRVEGIRVFNHINRREMSFKSNPKNSKIGADSSCLLFKNEEPDDIKKIKKECQKILRGYVIGDIESVTCHIKNNPRVAEIQKNLLIAMASDTNYDIYTMSSVIGSIKNSESIAKIQQNLFNLCSKNNLKSHGISTVLSRVRKDEEIAKIQNNILEKVIKNNKNCSDIIDVCSSISETKLIAKKQEKFINDLYDNKPPYVNHPIRHNIDMIVRTMYYIRKRPDTNIESIIKYMEEIDFEALAKKAPQISNYNFTNKLTFADYHLRNGGKKDFAEEDLTFDTDLSEFLSNNYLNGNSLDDLLTVFPLTKREVGQVPDDWLNKIPENKKDETVEKIYSAVSDFQKSNNKKLFAKNLSEILSKKVKIKRLGEGTYGVGYKISIEGAQNTCLKMFSNNDEILTRHGEHAEVQAGLFANKHSADFVKMYFGRVSPRNIHDGFLVTQFLNNHTKIDNSIGFEKETYRISSSDTEKNHNIIKGKIFDFGALVIKDKQTGAQIKPFSIFD